MKNERGSLENRIKNYGLDPDPEVWKKLENNLKQKRRRRMFFWLFFGALLLITGSVVVNEFQRTESRSEIVAVERSNLLVEEPTAQNKTSNQPRAHSLVQPKEKAPTPKTNEETEPDFSENASNKKSESLEQPATTLNSSEPKSRWDENSKALKYEAVLAIPFVNKTRNKESTEEKKDEFIVSCRLIKKDRNRRRAAIFGEAENQFRNPESNLVKNEVDPASKSTENQQQIEMVPSETLAQASQNPPSGNLENAGKTENIHVPTDSISEVNLKPKAVDSTIVQEKTSSPDSTIAEPKRTLSFSLIGALKVAAQRTFELNRGTLGSRTTFNKDNGWNPYRLAFDLTGRLDKNILSWFGLYFQFGLGMVQDQVDVTVKPSTVTSYDLVAEGEQLNVKSVYTLDKQQIRSRSVFTNSSLGLALTPFRNKTALRLGVGNIWTFYSMSELKSSLPAKSNRWEKLGFERNLWFIQAGLSKSLALGKKNTLLVEPIVQYFTRPVFYQTEGMRATPLYVGLQVGWKW